VYLQREAASNAWGQPLEAVVGEAVGTKDTGVVDSFSKTEFSKTVVVQVDSLQALSKLNDILQRKY
jgi:hypothetical protein